MTPNPEIITRNPVARNPEPDAGWWWCDLNTGTQQALAPSRSEPEYAAGLLPQLVALGGRIPGASQLTFLVTCLSSGAAQLRVSVCQHHVRLVAAGLQPGNEAASDWSSLRELAEELHRPQPLPPQDRPPEVWLAVYETSADRLIPATDRAALEKFLQSLPGLLPAATAELAAQPPQF